MDVPRRLPVWEEDKLVIRGCSAAWGNDNCLKSHTKKYLLLTRLRRVCRATSS